MPEKWWIGNDDADPLFTCTYCRGTRMVMIRREDGYHVYMRCPGCTLHRREVPRGT